MSTGCSSDSSTEQPIVLQPNTLKTEHQVVPINSIGHIQGDSESDEGSLSGAPVFTFPTFLFVSNH